MKKNLIILGIIGSLLTPLGVFAQVPATTPTANQLLFADLERKVAELNILIARYKTNGITETEKKNVTKEMEAIKTQAMSLLRTVDRAAVNQNTTNSGPYCYRFIQSLSQGKTGNDVIALNAILDKAGYGTELTSKGVYPSTFSSLLTAKVKKYQTSKGIQSTGTVGPLTRSSLNSVFGCSNDDLKVTVVQPQGKRFEVGSTITFQWYTYAVLGVGQITLIPETAGQPVVTVYKMAPTGFPLTTNSYEWKVPADIAHGQYKVKVEMGSVGTINDTTETPITIGDPIMEVRTFTPTAPSSASSAATELTLKTLNGGTAVVYNKGASYPLWWSTDTAGNLIVDIRNESTGKVTRIGTLTSTIGENAVYITIPATLTSGKYKMKLTLGNASVYSEKAFTVESAATASPSPTTTATPQPSVTKTPTPTPSVTSTPTSTPIPTPTTASPSPSAIFYYSPSPTPTATPGR